MYREHLTKNGFRFVEKLLYEQSTHDTALAELEVELDTAIKALCDICEISAVQYSDMPKAVGGNSSPTERVALKKTEDMHIKYLRTRIAEKRRHQKAISEACKRLDETELNLVRLFYDKGKKPNECIKEMHMSRTKWYDMRQDVVHKVAEYLGVV